MLAATPLPTRDGCRLRQGLGRSVPPMRGKVSEQASIESSHAIVLWQGIWDGIGAAAEHDLFGSGSGME